MMILTDIVPLIVFWGSFDYFHKFQNTVVDRIASPYSPEYGSLAYWRARILSSVLFAAFILCTFATLSGITVAIKENAWGLVVFNFFWLSEAISLTSILPSSGHCRRWWLQASTSWF
jgi:hypothetical protein